MEIREFNKKESKRVTSEQSAEMIKKIRKEHDKLVKGMFEFLDAQGGWLEFGVRFFKGEPLTIIKLIHGEICELPMGIVKHLNNTKKKVRTMAPNIAESGTIRGIPATYSVQSRVRFTPVDVM